MIIFTLSIVGAILKKRGAIKAFLVILMVHLLFSLGSGAYSIYRFFQDSKNETNVCIGGSTDTAIIKECHKAMKIMKAVLIVVFMFVWFMEICMFLSASYVSTGLTSVLTGGCIIVNNYAAQLQEEEESQSNKDFEAVRPQW